MPFAFDACVVPTLQLVPKQALEMVIRCVPTAAHPGWFEGVSGSRASIIHRCCRMNVDVVASGTCCSRLPDLFCFSKATSGE